MVNNLYALVSPAIMEEVLRSKDSLRHNPNFSLNLLRKRMKTLQKEANRHSVDIELGGFGTSPAERKLKSKVREECRANLSNAWDWGMQNYSDPLSEYFIEEAGRIIEPNENFLGFRTKNVRITGASTFPPSYDKLRRELASFLIMNSSLANPLERALHAHFHLARIHPFFDGNGRTARLVQNIILNSDGCFPITIKPSERTQYIHLIGDAAKSYKGAESNLDSVRDSLYLEARGKILRGDLTQKAMDYYSRIVLDTTKKFMTPEQNKFYNFLASKLKKLIDSEAERIS